jgi:starch synthase (maltosyl-transferring)
MEPTLGTEEIGKRAVDVPAQPRTQAPPPRIRIQLPRPTIEEGRWPIKRTVGDTIAVSADIFRDGH